MVSEEYRNKVVFRLVGDDVICILKSMGKDNLPDEEIEKIIDFVKNKLVIPWDEYMECALDYYFSEVKNKN